jgi:GNAT superfamily N-acetyltransferase
MLGWKEADEAMPVTAARVRPFGAADLAACVAISNAVDPTHSTSLAAAQRRDAMWDRQHYHLARFVAQDAAEGVVGWGEVAHEPWQFHPRQYGLRLAVASASRRRGVGGALLARLLADLQRRDALLVRAAVTEGDAASLAFLTRRGFREVWRNLASRLDVGAFDPAPFAAAAERVARQGVALSTLAAELARDAGVLREVYDLYVLCNRGQEELDPVTPPEFAAFVAAELEGPQALPEAWFLARAGGRLVGLSTLERLTGAADALEAGYTAVHPEHRGRGLALALKLRTIAYAAGHGYREIRTDSNAGNTRMLGINAALGFAPEPARLTLERRLP